MKEPATIPLTRGKFTIIDADDLPIVEGRSWQAHERRDGKGWYAVSDGTRMHRLLMNAPSNQIVDHRDGDGLNNRRGNLRIGTVCVALNATNLALTRAVAEHEPRFASGVVDGFDGHVGWSVVISEKSLWNC